MTRSLLDRWGVRGAVFAGIAFMVLGTSLLPLMNTFAKTLASEFILWQVTWARFTGHLLLMSLVFCPREGFGVYRSGRPGLQLVRSCVFFASNVFFIGGLPHVSLATASSIMFTAPIIVTALSVIFLGERVGLWRWGAVAMGFTGALVIVRPGAASFEPATLLVLASAVCYAVYQLLTRRLSAYDSAPTQIIWTALVGAMVTTCIVPFVGRMPDHAGQVLAFIALGSIGAIAHLLVIQALKRAPASVMAPIGYVELVGAAALGFLVFGDIPDAATWLGAGLIIGSGLVIAWREAVRHRPAGARVASRSAGATMMVTGSVLVLIGMALYLNR